MIEKAAPVNKVDLSSEHQQEQPKERESNEHGEVYFTQSLLRVMQETLTGQRVSQQSLDEVVGHTDFDDAYDRMRADSALRRATLNK